MGQVKESFHTPGSVYLSRPSSHLAAFDFQGTMTGHPQKQLFEY